MNPTDFAKTMTDFWTSQGQVMMKAQEQATRAMTDGMKAMANGTMPAMPTMLGAAGDLSGGAAELARASQSILDLWSAATTMSGELATKLGAPLHAGTADATITAVFGRIADPRQWMAGTGEMDDVLGRMAEGPRLADLWEVERHYARVMRAWMTVRQSGLEHNAIVLQGWLDAGRRFMEDLAARTAGEAKTQPQPPDPKAAMKLWTEVANQQLLQTQRSEPFLKTQREMIRASTELRMAQQELVEHFGKQYGFPTRTELDDVHRTVTELRRELRLLRREIRTQQPAPITVPKEPARATIPARRSESRKRESRK